MPRITPESHAAARAEFLREAAQAYDHMFSEGPVTFAEREDLAIMLRCFLIQKAVNELGKALNSRREEVDLHLRGLEMTLREYECL